MASPRDLARESGDGSLPGRASCPRTRRGAAVPRLAPSPAGDPRTEPRTLPGAQGGWMFTVGLAVRIAFLTVFGAYVFRPDYFGFGWEAGRIASALADGRGFSDPFHGPTGPTAWLAPLYPFVLAGIFKLFGTYTPLSGWMTLAFNSICSAATSVVLYCLGAELFGEGTGRLAGWTWALLPYAVYWPTRVVWDTCLTAFLLALVVLLTIRLGRAPSRGDDGRS